MEWLEMVRLRGELPPEESSLVDDLGRLVRSADEQGFAEGRVAVDAHGRDLLVVLRWSGDFPDKEMRSRLGLAAASEMGRFGLVDHSVWKVKGTEKERCS